MDGAQILLVEDSEEIVEDNKRALLAAGYKVSTAGTLAEGKALLSQIQPDLILLDVLLPDGNGVALCREIRNITAAPILFLTSLGEAQQIVEGLQAGGDDYITKPYRMEELLARIAAQLRHTRRLLGKKLPVKLGDLELDNRSQKATLNGRDLLLKPKEFQLLSLLAQDIKTCITSDEIYTQVWGMNANADVRTVLVHISNIRTKLRGENDEGQVKILKEGDRGYRLALEPEEQI